MCGIAGFYNSSACYTANPEKWNRILTSMRAVLSHRGSDECGSYLSDCVGFAHARLAIRDLATGTQPIVRSFGGCEFAIVYNGELYNTEEIKNNCQMPVMCLRQQRILKFSCMPTTISAATLCSC